VNDLCTVCDQVILGDDLCPDGHADGCTFDTDGWCRCSEPSHRSCCRACSPQPIPGQLDLLGGV
jgi:hypothetical protein